MIVVSTRDFRANQTKFLDMANSGEDVVLRSREKGSFKLVPICIEETVTHKRDLMAELRDALQEVKDEKAGKHKMKTIEELLNEL